MKIIVTGAAGFIGGQIAGWLTQQGHDIIWVDKRPPDDPTRPYQHAQILTSYLAKKASEYHDVDAIVHMGACTNTLYGTGIGDRQGMEKYDKMYLNETNTDYTKTLWSWCVEHGKKFIYASSAATYGDGGLGFSEDMSTLFLLKPLNPYGESKHEFDLWAIKEAATKQAPPSWAGLKFFNVYGRNEATKGKMASMVYQLFHQAKGPGKVRLFKDGEQKRDFVWVGDILKIVDFMLFKSKPTGLFNVGTGKARTFNDVAQSIFTAVGRPCEIEYFDMPESLKPYYQNVSEARLDNLRKLGYQDEMVQIEDGIKTFLTAVPIFTQIP